MCTFLRSLAKINQNKKWNQKKKKKKKKKLKEKNLKYKFEILKK